MLAVETEQQLYKELRYSRVAIESQIGAECWAFKYPGGASGDVGAREFDALRGMRKALVSSLLAYVRP